MSMLSGDNPIWEDFLVTYNIYSEEEDEFLDYLYGEDYDPDQMSRKELDDAYSDFIEQ